MMRISLSACKEVPPLVSFPGGLNMDPFIPWRRKDKVVIVMGATGTGKSRLSIDLATRFPAEIVNSDKMQVYKGLDIATNKVTEEECLGIPHHLLGFVDPNEDFTAHDFQNHASLAVESIIRKGRLPIIAGGSNSYIKALVNDDLEFQSKYDCCFLWVDASVSILHSFVTKRVDKMVEAGLVDEVREFFNPKGDYSRGIRRAIGVPEMDQFFRNEKQVDEETGRKLLEEGIDKIKSNTCKLACCQLRNILRLQEQLGWNMHHLDATEAFLKRGAESDEAWERLVARPGTMIVGQFLEEDEFVSTLSTTPPSSSVIAAASVLATTNATAVAAATH
ncbi:adenylate isopentenyltransferase 5, chloroplastic-like [Coffea arabica]|uniref:adenylate dimethylallyltransferase (ADP/ATP-dependent) n=1 Tax=Coffea arabica TaxID=13443 RepID=A0A6P6WQ03_COFAR|nr:adenylate isopentenyltransferase 5, chloroplastic-like [Coffea arabica]XP_027120287.1 adenylate isopentenyltransferase 5, chloroplastic-like [Coffea arabica]